MQKIKKKLQVIGDDHLGAIEGNSASTSVSFWISPFKKELLTRRIDSVIIPSRRADFLCFFFAHVILFFS